MERKEEAEMRLVEHEEVLPKIGSATGSTIKPSRCLFVILMEEAEVEDCIQPTSTTPVPQLMEEVVAVQLPVALKCEDARGAQGLHFAGAGIGLVASRAASSSCLTL